MIRNLTKNKNILIITFEIIIFISIYLTSYYNFLLFHTIVELLCVSIAFCVFMIAWNSKNIAKNNLLLLLGIAYLFVGCLDLFHILSFKGMNIFTEYSADLPTQFWIAARYLTSISFLVALFALNKNFNEYITFLLYFIFFSLILLLIFYFKIFPVCYIVGKGLTPFKIISEYIISIIFLLSLIVLFLNKTEFNKKIFGFICFSIITTIVSEISFTFYFSVFGILNLIGHLFKLFSYYLIYKAFIEIGLKNPYSILFKKIDEKNKDLEQIINTLSHDLRSPLATINGFTNEINKSLKNVSTILEKKGIHSTIKKEIDPIITNDISEFQKYIKISISKVSTLLTGLTSLSKLESIKLNLKKIEMKTLIKTIFEIFKYQTNEKKINVIIESLPNCTSDKLQLNEVFSNLIENAIKYSDENKKSIIKVSGQKQKNEIIYCVEDNGLGISKKDELMIFDMFYRSNDSTTGDGLGLTIVKRIIEKLKGKIYFESKQGIGTKFYISLPIIKQL